MENQLQYYPISQQSKNIAAIMWLATIFFGFIPGLLVYFLKKEDGYLVDQSKEALNWSITVLVCAFAGQLLTVILVGFLILGIIGLCNFIFALLGAIAATSGKTYRTPFAIRLIN